MSRHLSVLKDLQTARAALVKERTRLRNQGHVQTNPTLIPTAPENDRSPSVSRIMDGG